MSERQRFPLTLGIITLTVAVLMQMPQLRHVMDARYQGVLVELNSDEDVYLARVSEALNGRGEQTSEAIVGDPTLAGTQPALLERMIGTAFRWTGWGAATVLQFMDSIFPPLLFLTLVWFFRVVGFARWQATVGATAFVLLQLYNLNRPIHQSGSFLLVLLSVIGLMRGINGNILLGILGGAIMGILTSIYVWGWMFAWAWWGLLLVWESVEVMLNRSRKVSFWFSIFSFRKKSRDGAIRVWRLLLFGVVGVLTALPYLVTMAETSKHPAFADTVFRSGIHPGRLPESWIYSVLFLIMASGLLLGSVADRKVFAPWKFAAITVTTAFLVLNQQVIHGVTFNFASHELFALVTSAITVILLWIPTRHPIVLISMLAAIVYIVGIAYDGRHILKQWRVDPARFERQHLASALPVLDTLPRTTILSDPDTSQFLAGATRHDVVYSLYLKNVLMTHERLAERYCVTQLPLPPGQKFIEENAQLLYPDALGAFKDPPLREQEVALVREACERLDRRPGEALKQFGVSYILVDGRRQPLWNVKRLLIPLEKVQESVGWTLYRVMSSSPE